MPDSRPKPLSKIFAEIRSSEQFGQSPLANPMVMAEAYGAKVDELHAIIDETDDLLGEIDCHQLSIDLGSLSEAGLDLADRLIKALNVVLDARAVLGRAIPEEEDENGQDTHDD